MKKMMIRTAAAFLAAAVFALPAGAQPAVSAESYILMDGDTGAVLAQKDADRRALIASTTKIMTAVVVLEHMPLDRVVEVPAEAAGTEGSSMYLKAGEKLTVEELLYGMMLQSGNDAAAALSMVCAGSVEEFAALMNLTAQTLELRNTHFENPTGLDGERQYSSAADLAKLTRFALEDPDFCRIVSTKNITFGDRVLTNHNRLLWTLDGCIGVKTGYTRAAGRILVSVAERSGRRLIAVTINDRNDWQDHEALYDFGFSNYEERVIVRPDDRIGIVPDLDGRRYELLAGHELRCFLSSEDRVRIIVNYPQIAFRAEERGSAAGFATAYVGTRKIGYINLLWGEEVRHEGENTEDYITARCSFPQSG